MSTIKVPDTITKLDPKDAYPVVEGEDVGGFPDLKTESADNKKRIEVAEGHLQTLQSNDKSHDSQLSAIGDDIRQLQGQVFNGIKIEDEDGNSFSDIKGIAISGGTVTDSGGTDEVNLNISPKVTVANGQTPDSTSATGNSLLFPGATITPDPHDTDVITVSIPAGTSGINLGDGVNASREVTTVVLRGHQAYGSGNTAEIHLEFAHFKTIAERDAWSTKFGAGMTYDTVAVVDADDNGFVAWYRFDSSTKAWKEYDAQGVIMSDSSGAIPKNIKTVVYGPGFSIQQAGDQEDAALVTYTPTGDDHSHDTELSVTQDWGTGASSTKVDAIQTLYPLEVNKNDASPLQGNAALSINPRAYEEQHAASCLLQLDSDLTLQTGRETVLYTSHEIIPTGEYFSLNQQASGVNVQDNTGGDTAVTGGELTRVMGSASFYGTASENSNVKVWFEYKDPASPLPASVLIDVNGHPMIVERQYNSGDDLSEPLVVAGAMMATGNAPIVMKVEVSAGSYVVNPDQTLICVEQFSDGYETSIASIEFQRRLGIELHAEIKQFTTKMLSMKDEILGKDEPEATIAANQGYDFLNEFGVQNLTPVKASISMGELGVKAANDIADFYVDIYLDNVKTSMLRGKEIDYDITMTNSNSAWYLEVYKWTGKKDSAGKIYTTRNNDALNLNTGFTLVKSKFIAEDPTAQFRGITDTVTVPNDAINLFIILRPEAAQSPMDLFIKDFTWGVPQPFRGYIETFRINLREQHLWFDESWAEFGLTAKDVGSPIRYTINATPSTGFPMPVGKLFKGKAPVEIDNTVNQVSGSADPQYDGGIKFLKDGEASISRTYNVRNETNTQNTVTFWDVLIDADGNETKIGDSQRTFVVPANLGAPGVVYTVPSYVIQVETGQRVAGRALASIKDGAYIQSDNVSEFAVNVEIDFKEEVTSASDDPDLISAPLQKALIVDRRVHSFSGNSEQNIVIGNLDIPADVELAHIDVVKHSGTKATSINTAEYSYDSATQELTVHVGSNATEVKIYLSFWGSIA